jgi:hypothetical protein
MSTTIKESTTAPGRQQNDTGLADDSSLEQGRLAVDGTGTMVIVNTGGSSASEGGMGSGSDDDREKGSLSKPGEKSGSATTDDDNNTSFDPLKKSAKEAEKAKDKE